MKKIITLVLALFIAAGIASAEQKTTVKGTILCGSLMDSETKEAEYMATIQFFSASDPDKLIAYAVTDENGEFENSLPSEGEYILYYSNIGRKDLKITFTLNGEERYEFGEILVEDDIEALNAATIVDQKVLVKMDVDKMTYKVSDDVDAQSSTVLDMLRKVPMVSVDGQDNITVNGSSNFKVYVDGKPNQMISANPSQVLKYMPASSIKNIEVVTNPGVRYDAEGAGGVLNLISNTDASGNKSSISDGQYGSVGINASTRGAGANIMYNVQKGKVSAGITANMMNQSMGGTQIDMERVQNTEAGDITTLNHNESKMSVPMKFVNANVNYEINSQNIISVTGGLMSFASNMDGLTSTSITMPAGTYKYDGTSLTKSSSNSITASVDYQHTWANNPEKNFLVSYQFSSSPSINNTLNTFDGYMMGMDLTDRKADGLSNSLSHSIQVDYITPVGQHSTFSTGAKFIYRNNSSDQSNYLWNGSEFVYTDNGSLTYDYYNKIGAAYTEFSSTFGKFSAKAGLRYEYTWQNVEYAKGQGTNFDVNYSNLVPAASIQYNIGMMQNIGLSYNMRISRPGISYLNPYVDTSDPTQISYGNSDLTTDNSHNFSLVYNYYAQKLMVNATLRYTLSPDGISQYSFYDSNNILNTTYGNIVASNVVGLNGFAMYTPNKSTRLMLNGSVSYSDLNSEILGQSNSGWSTTALIGIQQTIPFDIRLSANLITSGSQISLQGKSNGISMLTLGASKTFLDNSLSVSINGMVTKNGLTMKNESITVGDGFTSKTTMTVPMGQIQASVTYSFGNSRAASAKKARRVDVEDSQLNGQSMSQSLGSMVSGN